ncbi:MAG: PEGA domain-containing protein [Planctomycetota bacterium]
MGWRAGRKRWHSGVRGPIVVLLVAAVAALPGCLRRKIRITSDPPGAVVFLNQRPIGVTPAEAAFTFYGRYDVRLEAGGHEPLKTARTAHAPPWEWPVIDLAFELVPFPVEHTVAWHFELEPTPPRGSAAIRAREEALLEDADEIRSLTEEDRR